jgi:ubiquinone/menaquinone biosynthesis C-methylase UbiE
MNKDFYKNLVCPRCHAALSLENDRLRCAVCNESFLFHCGIPCFARGQSAWQFPLSASSSRLIEMAREHGWRASLSELDKGSANWIEGAERFPISVLASPKGQVLDAGCGWGALSFWLSKEFAHVCALDSQLDGLQFIDIRSAQDGVANISPVQGDLLSLPFPDRFFDLVLLNGVLEWAGTFSKEHSATTLQKMALREMARVLHPDGVLYIAIENRFGLQYFVGYKEEHTGLRFISLLPRRLANSYHKYRRGNEFRALTHSHRGLTKMLRKCGFQNTKRFLVFPSYRNCRYAASLEGTKALAFLFKNTLSHRSSWPAKFAKIGLRAISKTSFFLKILSSFSPSWIIFASQRSTPQLALQGKEKLIYLETERHLAAAIALNERRANIFMIDESSGALKGKYAIPVNQLAQKKIEMSHVSIELIRKLRPSLSKNLPEISNYGTKQSLLEFTKGIPGNPLNPNKPEDVTPLIHLLMELSKVSIDENEMQRIPESFDVRSRLKELANTHGLSKRIVDLLGRPQIIHGDLEKRNILFCGAKPRLLVLIDFEHAKVGPGVLNWYDFLLRNFVTYGGQYPIKTSTILKRCRRLPGNKGAKEVLNRSTASFLEACGVSLALHGQLIALHMSYLCQDPVVTDPGYIISQLKSTNFHISL